MLQPTITHVLTEVVNMASPIRNNWAISGEYR
nr:MAG TPA: hypothetical protein [Caudoviricetes sp.]